MNWVLYDSANSRSGHGLANRPRPGCRCSYTPRLSHPPSPRFQVICAVCREQRRRAGHQENARGAGGHGEADGAERERGADGGEQGDEREDRGVVLLREALGDGATRQNWRRKRYKGRGGCVLHAGSGGNAKKDTRNGAEIEDLEATCRSVVLGYRVNPVAGSGC